MLPEISLNSEGNSFPMVTFGSELVPFLDHPFISPMLFLSYTVNEIISPFHNFGKTRLPQKRKKLALCQCRLWASSPQSISFPFPFLLIVLGAPNSHCCAELRNLVQPLLPSSAAGHRPARISRVYPGEQKGFSSYAPLPFEQRPRT